ncbi:hypothetical protein MTO96_005151 [Rhipicephalus appendiculatus]
MYCWAAYILSGEATGGLPSCDIALPPTAEDGITDGYHVDGAWDTHYNATELWEPQPDNTSPSHLSSPELNPTQHVLEGVEGDHLGGVQSQDSGTNDVPTNVTGTLNSPVDDLDAVVAELARRYFPHLLP